MIVIQLQQGVFAQDQCKYWMVKDSSDNMVIALIYPKDSLLKINLKDNSGQYQIDSILNSPLNSYTYPFSGFHESILTESEEKGCDILLNERNLNRFFFEFDSLYFYYNYWGNVYYKNVPELNKKYAVFFESQGCMVEPEDKILFPNLQILNQILIKRNGVCWKEDYMDALKKQSK